MRWLRRLLIGVVLLAVAAGAAFAGWQYLGRDRVRAQTPKMPPPYAREDAVVETTDGAHLRGTLTVPAGAGPRPAVVLLGVAGPNDRDLTYRGHKGFAVIADALARCGVATLRLDDRGEIAIGKRADLVIADLEGHVPIIREVHVRGRRVV